MALSQKKRNQVRGWAAEGRGFAWIADQLGCSPHDDDLAIAFAEGAPQLSEDELKAKEKQWKRNRYLKLAHRDV